MKKQNLLSMVSELLTIEGLRLLQMQAEQQGLNLEEGIEECLLETLKENGISIQFNSVKGQYWKIIENPTEFDLIPIKATLGSTDYMRIPRKYPTTLSVPKEFVTDDEIFGFHCSQVRGFMDGKFLICNKPVKTLDGSWVGVVKVKKNEKTDYFIGNFIEMNGFIYNLEGNLMIDSKNFEILGNVLGYTIPNHHSNTLKIGPPAKTGERKRSIETNEHDKFFAASIHDGLKELARKNNIATDVQLLRILNRELEAIKDYSIGPNSVECYWKRFNDFSEWTTIPIFGGLHSNNIQNYAETESRFFKVPAKLVENKPGAFCFRVESVNGLYHFSRDDILICAPWVDAGQNPVVVMTFPKEIQDNAILCIYRLKGKKVCIFGDGSRMEDVDKVNVVGTVIGVVREYPVETAALIKRQT